MESNKKVLQNEISDSETSTHDAKESITTLKAETTEELVTSEEALGRFRFAAVKWYRNVGTNAAPKFREGGFLRHDGWPIVAGGHNCAVHAVDWDGDGKLELILVTDNGQLCLLDHNEFAFDIP